MCSFDADPCTTPMANPDTFRLLGVVKKTNKLKGKGYGFITADHIVGDIFFHVKEEGNMVILRCHVSVIRPGTDR
jgi:hypothetical protein